VIDSRRALELFEEVVELDAAERSALLDQHCANEPALRTEVDALLAADARASDFLEQPLLAAADRSGERLGGWRLEELIGVGGMGSVYRATRADHAYAKTAAIKFLLFDAGDLRRRFALEQRILGGLNHPNIAGLLDVGADANGAPYFVMEYVDGAPITEYVRTQALDLRARIGLFLNILDAVQTAHSQLIVHRDIKPSNVLVDKRGIPKLLDFGIAKLLEDGAAAQTRTGLGPLTPEYASPEQVRAQPIGTPSDIYSLGVLLYELVTFERPYKIGDTSPSGIERTICDTDPPRPSTRVPARSLPGNARALDAVVLKALEKQPSKRYHSCAEFAADLRRWLDGSSVIAREPLPRERVGRYLRRHRTGVAVTVAATLALVAGSVVALWEAHVAGIQRDRTERINRFLVDMLGAANPSDLGRKVTVAEVLDRARRQAQVELASDPATLAATELTLARTYNALGDLDAAKNSAGLALAAAHKAGDSTASIDAQLVMGEVLFSRGDFAEGKSLLDVARQDARDRGSAIQQAEAAHQLGLLEDSRGDDEQAQRWLETALSELPENAIEERAETLNDLALIKGALNDHAANLALQQQAVDLWRSAHPDGHAMLAQALSNLAVALDDNGRHDEAGKVYAQALKMRTEFFGDSHPGVVGTLSSMTYHDILGKDVPAALDHGAQAWASAQKLLPGHPNVGYAAIMYAEALMLAGRSSEAVPLIETSLKIRKTQHPDDHPLVINTESVLGLARAQSGDIDAGEALAQSAYTRQLAKLGEKKDLTIAAKNRLEEIRSMRMAANK
jgi:tetratricopeptide (TPR) repeat protein